MKKAEQQALDELIHSLRHKDQFRVRGPDVSRLISSARSIFMAEPTVLDLHTPINVCGDIHGQFCDLLAIFELAEAPPNNRFLFLGDYVDRGPMSVEVMCLLLAMKVRFPNHIYLIRGNHETRETTMEYGFADECIGKTSKAVYGEFCELFDVLPIAAVISGSFFCVHGGIAPTLKSVDQIREIVRPADASYKGFLADLLWSDPDASTEEWADSQRGDTVVWGVSPAREFLSANRLRMIIRAHQMVDNGFEYPFEPDRCVVTVFSAPCYAGEARNRGAFILIDKSMKVTPILLPHHPEGDAGRKSARPETPHGGRGGKGKDKGRGKRKK